LSTQQPAPMRRIGSLIPFADSDTLAQNQVAAFREELQRLGWTDNRNVQIVARWTGGDTGQIPFVARELVRLKPDVILAYTTAVTAALKQETDTIPIVFVVVSDPVGDGFVASMARPGGNTTGISIFASELDVKRLQLLHELVPQAARMGILADPTTISTRPQLEAAAPALGLELIIALAANPEEIGVALDHLASEGLDAVNVLASPILDDARDLIIVGLNRVRLPAIYQWPELAEFGGFAGYGPRLAGVIRDAIRIVDKILRGARPGDIPVEQPTRFEFVINLKTAKTLGVNIPAALIARADEVIE